LTLGGIKNKKGFKMFYFMNLKQWSYLDVAKRRRFWKTAITFVPNAGGS
jgi:hypothetical protein